MGIICTLPEEEEFEMEEGEQEEGEGVERSEVEGVEGRAGEEPGM